MYLVTGCDLDESKFSVAEKTLRVVSILLSSCGFASCTTFSVVKNSGSEIVFRGLFALFYLSNFSRKGDPRPADIREGEGREHTRPPLQFSATSAWHSMSLWGGHRSAGTVRLPVYGWRGTT